MERPTKHDTPNYWIVFYASECYCFLWIMLMPMFEYFDKKTKRKSAEKAKKHLKNVGINIIW